MKKPKFTWEEFEKGWQNAIPYVETGDVVELRNGTICIMLSDAFLNFNNKIVETKLEDYIGENLYCKYNRKDYDIMKIKHDINPFDYFNLDKIEIEWDWIRE